MNQVDAGVMLWPVPELKKKTWLVASIADEMAISFGTVGAIARTATEARQGHGQCEHLSNIETIHLTPHRLERGR